MNKRRPGSALVHAVGAVTLWLVLTGIATAAGTRGTTERIPLPFMSTAYPSTYQPLPRQDTLIRGATILDGAGHRLDGGDVLLQHGTVIAVGTDLVAPTGAQVIDAHGKWVTPGIVDPHSHLGDFPTPYTAEDSQHSDVNEDSDPNTAQVWALHSMNAQDPGFARALAGGVTTLQILPGSTNLFGGRSVIIHNVPATTVEAMIFPAAPQGLKMACGENVIHAYGDSGRFPVSRMGAISGQRAAWLEARRYLAGWLKYERGEAKEPPQRDLRLDTLAAALQGEILIHIHCYRADDMAQMLGMAKEFGYHITAFHHAVEAYKIAPLLVRDNVCVAVWPDWWGYKREAYDGIRENAAYVDYAGGCVTMHSDSSLIGQWLNLEAAKAMAAGRRAGIPITRRHAIEWITSNPARILGIADRTGSLVAGRAADVVIWSGDPFSIYTHAEKVFIDGALVYDRHNPARRPLSDLELGQQDVGRRP